MSPPYWGELPSPKSATQPKGRRTSEDYAYNHHERDLHPLDTGAGPSRPNRASVQTTNTDAPTESTLSPFASPTTASFAGGGLAPRPPSLPYGTTQYPSDLLEKRARRASRNREEAAKLPATMTPSPAFDQAPQTGPPLSYRQPHGNGASPHVTALPPPSTRQSRRSSGMGDHNQKDAPLEQPRDDYPVLDRSRQTFDPATASRRSSNGGESVRRPSQRRGDDGQGGYTNDHSPLQRLELRLGSITKEDKRARMELAEQRARERVQRGQVPQQVRFSDRQPPPQPIEQVVKRTPPAPPAQPRGSQEEVPQATASLSRGIPEDQYALASASTRVAPTVRAIVPPPAPAPAPIAAPIPAAVPAVVPAVVPAPAPALAVAPVAAPVSNPGRQAYSSVETGWGPGPLSQNPPETLRAYPLVWDSRPEIAPESPKGPIPGVKGLGIQRNLSFKERAVRNQMKLVGVEDVPPPPSAPEDPKPRTDERRRSFSLTRSGSNKLKKRSPPQETIPKFNRDAQTDTPSPPPDGQRGELPVARGSSLRYKPVPPPPAADAVQQTSPKPREVKLDSPLLPQIVNKLTKSPRGSPRRHSQDSDIPGVASAWDSAPPQRAASNRFALPTTGGSAALRYLSGNSVYEARQHREEERDDASSSSDGGRATPRSHNFTDRMYNAKQSLEPGRGMYLQPPILDEWKKATVGTLEGDNLDISQAKFSTADQEKKAWWEDEGGQRPGSMSSRPKKAEAFEGEYDDTNVPSRFKPNLYLKCGPLLRYCGMRTDSGITRAGRGGIAQKRDIWRGTVMIVTRDKDSSYDIVPTLRLFAQPIELLPPPPEEIAGGQALPPEYVDPLVGHTKVGRRGETLYMRPVEHLEEARDVSRDETDEGLFEKTRSPPDYPVEDGSEPHGAFASRKKRIEVDGEKVGKYTEVRGFRLHAERGCTFWRFNIEVELQDKQQRIAYRINRGPATAFWVPAKGESMNIMFSSCNGFSLSRNSNEFSGPDPMWRDVLNTHQTQPFHVMLGGGDQIYNDAVQQETELFQEWLMIRNTYTKVHQPFSTDMQDELEEFYLERYCMWFSQGLFGLANSQIPMVNMFDDHDLIDGFGSYPHHFMNSPVFSGLGNVAFKYYMLFQHQSVLDESEDTEPSWVLGAKPGPYINSRSRSMFMMLGSKTALLAVDCRTERTREEVVSKETWERIMDRCYTELEKGKMSHILVMLGVPIAYPRLVWLENILTSRLMDPIKALGKAGIFGNLLNHLDGGVEVLDDLDDHWTAKSHKPERTIVVQDLQDLAADKSIRITILSGDVHLGAAGQFFSNPKLGLAKHKDFRYMPNVISSAIANAPPPALAADILNKRNKIHHFDKDTDEDMIPLFTHGVDGRPRNNKHLLPHRNWCAIREYVPSRALPTTPNRDYERSPVGTPPGTAKSHGTGGLLRRLSKRARTSDFGKQKSDRSRPPISNLGGLLRSFSRRASSDHVAAAPQDQKTIPKPKRTLSLTRGDFGGMFGSLRRKKKRPDDGGINGTWGDEDNDSYDSFEEQRHARELQARREHEARRGGPQQQGHSKPVMGIRGGGRATPPDDEDYDMEYQEGDESYFTVRPSRTKSGRVAHKHHALGRPHPDPTSPVEMLHQAKMSHDKALPDPPAEHAIGLGRWGSLGRSKQPPAQQQQEQQQPHHFHPTQYPQQRDQAPLPNSLPPLSKYRHHEDYPTSPTEYHKQQQPESGKKFAQPLIQQEMAPDQLKEEQHQHQHQQHQQHQAMMDRGVMMQDEFVPRPFHRTPTGMSAKQIKKLGLEKVEVNLEGGLQITLNVEINQNDPSGITIPYTLMVPRLWYEYEGEENVHDKKAVTGTGGGDDGGVKGIGKWLSFRKRNNRRREVGNLEKDGEENGARVGDDNGDKLRY